MQTSHKPTRTNRPNVSTRLKITDYDPLCILPYRSFRPAIFSPPLQKHKPQQTKKIQETECVSKSNLLIYEGITIKLCVFTSGQKQILQNEVDRSC